MRTRVKGAYGRKGQCSGRVGEVAGGGDGVEQRRIRLENGGAWPVGQGSRGSLEVLVWGQGGAWGSGMGGEGRGSDQTPSATGFPLCAAKSRGVKKKKNHFIVAGGSNTWFAG